MKMCNLFCIQDGNGGLAMGRGNHASQQSLSATQKEASAEAFLEETSEEEALVSNAPPVKGLSDELAGALEKDIQDGAFDERDLSKAEAATIQALVTDAWENTEIATDNNPNADNFNISSYPRAVEMLSVIQNGNYDRAFRGVGAQFENIDFLLTRTNENKLVDPLVHRAIALAAPNVIRNMNFRQATAYLNQQRRPFEQIKGDNPDRKLWLDRARAQAIKVVRDDANSNTATAARSQRMLRSIAKDALDR